LTVYNDDLVAGGEYFTTAGGNISVSWARWGPVPCSAGDVNCDGVVNGADARAFVTALIDPAGYAAALEAFDVRIPEIETALCAGDLVVITADHGCDPTWPGTDHTREQVPILAFGPSILPGPVGRRDTFADVAATVAAHLELPPSSYGRVF